MRRTGYRALKKIVYSSYYGARETWAAIGYPGPPPTGGMVEREPRFVPGTITEGAPPGPLGPPPPVARGEAVTDAPGRIVDAPRSARTWTTGPTSAWWAPGRAARWWRRAWPRAGSG